MGEEWIDLTYKVHSEYEEPINDFEDSTKEEE